MNKILVNREQFNCIKLIVTILTFNKKKTVKIFFINKVQSCKLYIIIFIALLELFRKNKQEFELIKHHRKHIMVVR